MSFQTSMSSHHGLKRPPSRPPPKRPPSTTPSDGGTQTKSLHPMQACLRKLTEVDKLPRVDQNGVAHIAPTANQKKGRASGNDRTVFNCERELRKHLDTVMPNRPKHIPIPARLRAERNREGPLWTKGSMAAAMQECMTPDDLEIVFVCPEVFDRDLLVRDKKHTVAGDSTRLTSCCPKCEGPLRLTGHTAQRPSCQKVLRKDLCHTVVVGAELKCCNVEDGCCKKVKTKNGCKRDSPKNCTTCSKDIWIQHPESVRNRHKDYIDSFDDKKTKQTWCSPGFCDRLLFLRGSFEAFSQDIEDSLLDRCRASAKSYCRFSNEQKEVPQKKPTGMTAETYQHYSDLKWPVFAMDEMKGHFDSSVPSAKTVVSMFHELHETVEEHSHRDLHSRVPGRLIRIDGTCKTMKKTMNAPEAAEPNDAHIKVMGECNHVLTFAQAGAEGNLVAERLLHCLHKRTKRLGGQEAVDELVAAHSDTCCQNLEDPKQHFITKLFRNCRRAPLKDVFHGVQLLIRETAGFGHPLHSPFSDGIWELILKWEKESQDEALAHCMKNDEEGKTIKSLEIAREQMMKNKRCRDSMFNFMSADTEGVATAVENLFMTLKSEDINLKQHADDKGDTHRHYFKSGGGDNIGADDAVKVFCWHLRRGCFVDPFPVREMSCPLSAKKPKDGGPVQLGRRRGTNSVESNNLHGERATTGHATRQSSRLTHRRFMLFAFLHNLKMDKKIEHVTKKKARPRDWFIREALSQQVCHHTESQPFPDECPGACTPAEHFEPIGEECQKCNEWQAVDKEIAAFKSASHSAMSVESPDNNVNGNDADNSPANDAGTPERITDETLGDTVNADDNEHATIDNCNNSDKNDNDDMFGEPNDDDDMFQDAVPNESDMPPSVGVPAPVVAPAAGPVAKKGRADSNRGPPAGGCGAVRHGNRLGGMPSFTPHNAHMQSERLSPLQREMLFAACQQVHRTHGDQLRPKDVWEQVASLFNTWHTAQCQKDYTGFGGKLSAKLVERVFKNEGSNIMKGNLGLQAVAHPLPHPAPSFANPRLERGPTVPVVHGGSAAPAAAILTADDVDAMSQRDCKTRLRALGLTVRGTVAQLRKRLRKHHRV